MKAAQWPSLDGVFRHGFAGSTRAREEGYTSDERDYAEDTRLRIRLSNYCGSASEEVQEKHHDADD